MRVNLTLPGFGNGGGQAPPPPPDPLPRPPRRVDAQAELAARGRRSGGRRPDSYRTEGGAAGLMNGGSINTALKNLTGQ